MWGMDKETRQFESGTQQLGREKRILGLHRNIFFLGLTSFFNDFSSEMVFSVFPAFFTSVLKAGAQSLGLVDGIAEAASNFLKIYSGRLSDTVQRRKSLVVWGYAISTITRPFYVFAASVGGVLGLRVTDRIGKGLRDAPRDAIISLSSPADELGRSFGYHRAMDTMGGILGPLAAFIILEYVPGRFDVVFLSAFAIGILAIITLFFISDVVTSFQCKKSDFVGSFRALSPQFKLFLVSVFILSMGSLPIAVMLLKAQSIGLMIASVPLFYMLYNMSYSAFSLSAGELSDHIGARKVIIAGYLILIASYFVLNMAEGVYVLIAGFLLLGLFPALTDGVQRSLASKLTAENVRGGGLGWLNAATGFGALFAGIGGGYLWQVYGQTAAFVSAAAVIAIGLVIFTITSVWSDRI
jgi:MFS family permease